MQFDDAVDHVRRTIAEAPLSTFAVPHLVVDNVLPESLIAAIEANWPDDADGFQPEVPGNHILHVQARNLRTMTPARRQFWRGFGAALWPAMVGAVSEALSRPLTEAFGADYAKGLALQMPFTLMQADPSYPGHGMHTHFYHCPHWAFTMLLYVDRADRLSRGTGLHRLLPLDGPNGDPSSYQADDASWRADIAIDTFHWLDPQKPERRYQDEVVDYRANRLFVFMDGPLALHSVPFDRPDGRPDPTRAADGGRHARRRILRSHVGVEARSFFARHAASLRAPFGLKRYADLLKPNRVLSRDEQHYRDAVLYPFYLERLHAYVRAAEAARRPVARDPARPFGAGFYAPRKFTVDALRRRLAGWQ